MSAALGAQTVLQRMNRVHALPALPVVVNAVLRDINNPRSHAGHIGRLLAHDQALTARILRMANSAFYAPKDTVRNVEQAVVLLGLSTVNAILVKASIFDAIDAQKAKPFWLHALGAACCARAIARLARIGREDEAFVMGLLHDIGKLALESEFKDEYAMARNLVSHQGGLIRDAEENIFGCDHSMVGQHLCTRWSLPHDFIEAIGFHHCPDRASENGIRWASCVHLADICARALLIGNGGDNSIPIVNDTAMKTLGLRNQDFEKMFVLAEEELEKAEAYFNLFIDEG